MLFRKSVPKFDNQYNLESTRSGEEVSQLEELKKESVE